MAGLTRHRGEGGNAFVHGDIYGMAGLPNLLSPGVRLRRVPRPQPCIRAGCVLPSAFILVEWH